MSQAPEFDAIKSKMKSTWEAGDYGTFARYMEPGAVEIFRCWNITPGQQMLDVGCGAGQIAIPAAKDAVKVTGVDIAANLIQQARSRAQAEGIDAQFEEGDAEQLPFPDASFDVVVSLIGAMFAPRPEKVAAELLRVCRPGGRIIMGNWTPQSLPAHMFKTIGKYLPPPPDVPFPPLWGEEGTARHRFSHGTSSLTLTRRYYPSWTYPFAIEQAVEFFGQYFGPVHRAFTALGDSAKAELRHELEQLFAQFNEATDGTTSLKGEYLEIVATRS